jgi:hypothetical protein
MKRTSDNVTVKEFLAKEGLHANSFKTPNGRRVRQDARMGTLRARTSVTNPKVT